MIPSIGWFKSLVAGLVAVLVSIPIGFIVLALILRAKSGLPSIGIDVVTLSRNFVVRLAIVLVFLLGFLWEYNRVARN